MQYQKAGRTEAGLLAVLTGLTVASMVFVIWQASTLQPIRLPALMIDRLSAIIGLLVAGIGTICFHFSIRYLDGEPGQQRFLRWLFFTVVMAYVLILATNLLLLIAAWACTSLGLHHLLTFYHHRPEAQRPARKKFLISRLGDLALLSAILVIWFQWGTLDLQIFLQHVAVPTAWSGAPLGAALLIVVAALTKSAQFPFHTWLPETMEAPTPVSALMHAGIINAGGFLILRFAPLISAVPEALFLLALVGTLTVGFGTLSLWTQTDIKRTLAWSTISQMGFMIIQCGLVVFPAAILHMMGHGCYKAWSFLRSGGLPDSTIASPAMEPRSALAYSAGGTLLAVPALALATSITQYDPFHSPGELALLAMLALSIGQLWVALFGVHMQHTFMRLSIGLLATMTIALGACSLYKGAALFFAPVFGQLPGTGTPLHWIAAALPVILMTSLIVFRALLPAIEQSAFGRALYVYALNGFYIGIYANQIVDWLWRQPTMREKYAAIRRQKSEA